MKILSKSEYLRKGKLIQDKIFTGLNLYSSSPIFSEVITERLILFNYEDNSGYTLSKRLEEAIFMAAKEIGETGLYISILTHEDYSIEDDPLYWHLDLSEEDLYQNLIWGPLENIIFSENGTWGVLLSFDGIGLLGGKKQFISQIKLRIPDIDYQLSEFLEYWKDYERETYICTSWIPPLLRHIYGGRKSNKLLKIIGTNFTQGGVFSEKKPV